MTFTRQSVPDITATHEGVIMALWREGLDTAAIAHKMQIHEWQAYNCLSHLRRAPR